MADKITFDPSLLEASQSSGMGFDSAASPQPSSLPAPEEDYGYTPMQASDFNTPVEILSGLAGAGIGAMSPVPGGAFIGGAVAPRAGLELYKRLTGQENSSPAEMGLGVAGDAVIEGLTWGMGGLIKAGAKMTPEALALVKARGISADSFLSASKLSKIAKGKPVTLTASEVAEFNAIAKNTTLPGLAMIPNSKELASVLPLAEKAFRTPASQEFLDAVSKSGAGASELTTALKQYSDSIGEALGEARKAIKTPLDERIISEIQDDIANKIPLAVDETTSTAGQAMSGFTKTTEGLSGKYYKPLLEKARNGEATVGDLIEQYKAVSDDLAVKGADDLSGKIKGAEGNPSASRIAGEVKGLRAIKKVLKDRIGKIAEDYPDVRAANDLANKFADLKELEPYLGPVSEAMTAASGAKIASGVAPKPILGKYVAANPKAMVGQAAGVTNQVAAGRGAVSGEFAATLQNQSLPGSLALMSRGEVPQVTIPDGLRTSFGQFAQEMAPAAPALTEGLFYTGEAQSQEVAPPPRFVPRAGSPGNNLGRLSVALSKDLGPEAEKVTGRLQDALSSGSEIEQNKIMGAILMISPEARALYEPGITSAKSEYGGIIADPSEKIAMIGQVRQLTKGRRLSSIEAANFIEKLNTDTPFESVPEGLRRKTDRSLAPLVDPYSFVTPQPPK